MLSAKNRPQKPITSIAIASTPASGPSPTAITKIRPHTRSGMVLLTVTTALLSAYSVQCGVVFRAARTATGRLRMTPMMVPNSAISTVTRSALRIGPIRLTSGGTASCDELAQREVQSANESGRTAAPWVQPSPAVTDDQHDDEREQARRRARAGESVCSVASTVALFTTWSRHRSIPAVRHRNRGPTGRNQQHRCRNPTPGRHIAMPGRSDEVPPPR